MNRSLLIAAGVILTLLARAEADPPPATHDASFNQEGLFKADVSSLKDTELVAHLNVPLDKSKNVLWCGTLQLVWNKAIDLVGEKLHFTTPSSIADLLNDQDFTNADLDSASYVALADFERNNVEDEIRAALEKKFAGAASPELIPPKPAKPGPDDFVAYAYLYKDLAFAQPFADNNPLTFETATVANFGFGNDLSRLPAGVMGQVSIYDYQSQDNFIIKLKTKAPEDELILAKLEPGATLQETIGTVLDRLAGRQPEEMGPEPILAIPKLNFDLRRDFPELEGLVLQPGPLANVKNLVISKVKQLVRFQLNERGAILKSEAVMFAPGSAMAGPEPRRHIMIFDKPFLILMKRTDSTHPYFALWVGNSSLLMPATGK